MLRLHAQFQPGRKTLVITISSFKRGYLNFEPGFEPGLELGSEPGFELGSEPGFQPGFEQE